MSDDLCDRLKYELNMREYNIDNTVKYDTNKIIYITSIRLNFYQLWAMFNQVPIVYENIENGETIKQYEYRIQQDEDIYVIYANSNEKEGFLKIRNWNIGSTSRRKNDIDGFLRHLNNALKMYKEYYKCIERHIFNSENIYINEHMQLIKDGLLRNRDILKML